MRRDGKGFQKLTWAAGVRPDSPAAWESPAVKKSGEEPESDDASGSSGSVRPSGANGRLVSLFDGRTLKGWRPLYPQIGVCWSVKKHQLVGVSRANGTDLISDGVFNNFELHLEFLLGRGANSGVFLRGMYEIQLFTTISFGSSRSSLWSHLGLNALTKMPSSAQEDGICLT